MVEEIVHIDLFSGVGGFSYGFEQSKLNITHHYFSEIDKHAIAVYKYKFKNAEYVGSVIDVSGTEIRKRHPKAKFIITFGFPCQDLSVAGKGLGFDGKRSVLFFEAMRIVNEVKPEVFVFENVKGLLTHNNGETFEIVLRTIAYIGIYECEWQLLNTRWLLPQNRERIYFVGHLRGRSKPGVFPFRESDGIFAKGNKKRSGSGTYCTTITQNYHKGVHNQGETYINIRPVVDLTRGHKKQNGRLIKDNNDPDFTLNTQDRHCIFNGKSIRRLTEIECERLQGFPDNWTRYGNYDGIIKEVSRTQRYKQMGNAITTLWATHIANRLNF